MFVFQFFVMKDGDVAFFKCIFYLIFFIVGMFSRWVLDCLTLLEEEVHAPHLRFDCILDEAIFWAPSLGNRATLKFQLL